MFLVARYGHNNASLVSTSLGREICLRCYEGLSEEEEEQWDHLTFPSKVAMKGMQCPVSGAN